MFKVALMIGSLAPSVLSRANSFEKAILVLKFPFFCAKMFLVVVYPLSHQMVSYSVDITSMSIIGQSALLLSNGQHTVSEGVVSLEHGS